jgi:predicted RNA binding protein YcfA (HicA-like mRNA interferase family)
VLHAIGAGNDDAEGERPRASPGRRPPPSRSPRKCGGSRLTHGEDVQILAHELEMPRLPKRALETTRSRVAARLEREGWTVRHGSNHDRYKHPSKPGRIVMARHRTLSIGVARVIASPAGWVD